MDFTQSDRDYHKPVMPQEVMNLIAIEPGMTVVDGTVGMGGHSRLFADAVGPQGRLFGLDRDRSALALAKGNLDGSACNVTLLHTRYSEMESALGQVGVNRVDRVFLDIGVSSLQLNRAERGFAFSQDGPLDMRMDQDSGAPAAELIATLSEVELADIFYRFGEERASRRIARSIVETRGNETINTTGRLAEIVERAIGRRGRIHPATRVFQALRIAVNDELGEFDKGLDAARRLLAPGGRLVTITFHSLEDRIAKFRFREWKEQGLARVLTKKVIKPGRDETGDNPRARSAKLRAVELV